MVVMMVVYAIKEGHWDSIEEMNEVRNVAKMHGIFTTLFLYLVIIWKMSLPEFSYMISTRASEDSKAKIETGEKADIENPPPKYSEVLEITIENPPPNYSEVSRELFSNGLLNERGIKNPTAVTPATSTHPMPAMAEALEIMEKKSEEGPQITIENPPPKYSESNTQ
jgi:hypothetical protein